MSPCGITMSVRIWRNLYPNDDEVGGSVPTGTVLYENVMARKIEHLTRSRRVAEMDLLEQGLETEQQHLFFLYPSSLAIHENDEIEVVSPPNHREYLKKFRIYQEPQLEGYHPSDPRGYIIAPCKRVVVSHNVQ